MIVQHDKSNQIVWFNHDCTAWWNSKTDWKHNCIVTLVCSISKWINYWSNQKLILFDLLSDYLLLKWSDSPLSWYDTSDLEDLWVLLFFGLPGGRWISLYDLLDVYNLSDLNSIISPILLISVTTLISLPSRILLSL